MLRRWLLLSLSAILIAGAGCGNPKRHEAIVAHSDSEVPAQTTTPVPVPLGMPSVSVSPDTNRGYTDTEIAGQIQDRDDDTGTPFFTPAMAPNWGLGYDFACGDPTSTDHGRAFLVWFDDETDPRIQETRLSGKGFQLAEPTSTVGTLNHKLYVLGAAKCSFTLYYINKPASPSAVPPSQALFMKSGSGNTTLATPATPGTWVLDWSYDCHGQWLGITVRANGGRLLVDQVGSLGSGEYRTDGNPGHHTLMVESNCDWHVSIPR